MPKIAKFQSTFATDTSPSRGHPKLRADAQVGNLLASSAPADLASPHFYSFDLAAVGLGFHHFPSPQIAIERLVERVKPRTGIVLIVDWLPKAPSEGHAHSHEHGHMPSHAQDEGAAETIKTHGFSEEDMRGLFEAAGCTDFAFSVMEEPVELFIGQPERKVLQTVFLARATRGT